MRVSLLLRCRSQDDARERDAIDGILSPLVHVEVDWRVPSHPNDIFRVLVRKFVSGDERIVIAFTKDVTPVIQWGHLVESLEAICGDGGVVSSPTASPDGRSRFPTLRRRSNGSIARNTSAVMRGVSQDSVAAVPSVCWCPEVTILSGGMARRWSDLKTKSFVDQTAQCPHFVTTRPLVEHNDRIEDDLIDHDEGSDTSRPSDGEFVGLTKRSSGEERIQKYETLFRARLAVQSHRDGEA